MGMQEGKLAYLLGAGFRNHNSDAHRRRGEAAFPFLSFLLPLSYRFVAVLPANSPFGTPIPPHSFNAIQTPLSGDTAAWFLAELVIGMGTLFVAMPNCRRMPSSRLKSLTTKSSQSLLIAISLVARLAIKVQNISCLRG